MGCCGRPDPKPMLVPTPPPAPPPRTMNFAFDMGETITRYPAEFYTIMECLRRGGHRVVIFTNGPIPTNLGFDFGHFEVVEVGDADAKGVYCKNNDMCVLADDSVVVMSALHELSPGTARIRVMP